jgi:hypothetical protein
MLRRDPPQCATTRSGWVEQILISSPQIRFLFLSTRGEAVYCDSSRLAQAVAANGVALRT